MRYAQKNELHVRQILLSRWLTNVRHRDTIWSKFFWEDAGMTARSAFMNTASNCCTASTAAASSARICLALDTALLAVSILIVQILMTIS